MLLVTNTDSVMLQHQACATFNFLNGEKRCVAAALFPPKKMPSRNLDAYHIAEGLDRDLTRADKYFISPETGVSCETSTTSQHQI